MEGRLISETNGQTGEVIRDYIWLGLMPVAVIGATQEIEACDNEEQSALEAEIATTQDAIVDIEAEITALAPQIARFERLAQRLERIQTRWERRLNARRPFRRFWAAFVLQNFVNPAVEAVDNRIETLTAQRDDLTAQRAELGNQLEAQQTALTECLDRVESEASLHYLHADHLGRPVFATDADGAIVWDAGGTVTPFGEGVETAAAFVQALMFPGQYADVETGLSHNWHLSLIHI